MEPLKEIHRWGCTVQIYNPIPFPARFVLPLRRREDPSCHHGATCILPYTPMIHCIPSNCQPLMLPSWGWFLSALQSQQKEKQLINLKAWRGKLLLTEVYLGNGACILPIMGYLKVNLLCHLTYKEEEAGATCHLSTKASQKNLWVITVLVC